MATGGAHIVNTGIGWHEAQVPTIATSVPRAAFAWVTQMMKTEFAAAGITTPLVTSNHINTPEVAEQVLADGCADMVSMALPRLADAAFVKKAPQGRADRINPCIACNQACLEQELEAAGRTYWRCARGGRAGCQACYRPGGAAGGPLVMRVKRKFKENWPLALNG